MNLTDNETLLGGDCVHARAFGRLDAALGMKPTRFLVGDAAHLRNDYLTGYHEQQSKLATTAKYKAEWRSELGRA